MLDTGSANANDERIGMTLRNPIEEANEALALADKGQVQMAASRFEDLLQAHPEMAGARSNLGGLYTQIGQSTRAIEHLQRCLHDLPEFPEGWNNLGNALMQGCRMEEAFQAFSRAIALRPDYFEAHSNRFIVLRYRQAPEKTEASAVTEWREALARFPIASSPFRPLSSRNNSPPRIGFISPDFRNHSIAFFLEPLLQHLDRNCFQIYLYSDVRKPDATTARFRGLADYWRETTGQSHPMALSAIREDALDGLLDLTGHFQYNRLPLMAARAALKQISWLGFPGPTATPSIDARISDSTVDPEDSPSRQQERIIRLPQGYHCYQPPANAPPVAEAPLTENGFITFGSFNNAAKVSPAVARLWGRILEATPRSRLLLKARAFEDSATRDHIRKGIIGKRPIDPKRITFLPRSPALTEHLKVYERLDLALDTFPYAGTTTTCEALWMGVPTLTLTGPSPPSRVGLSLLRQVNLETFATSSPEAYVQTACALAKKPAFLSRIRSVLRARMQKTPLMDQAAFTRAFENGLLETLGQ